MKNKSLGKNIISSIYLYFGISFLFLFSAALIILYLNKNEINAFNFKISILFGVFLLLYIILTTVMTGKIKRLFKPLDDFVFNGTHENLNIFGDDNDIKRLIDYISAELECLSYLMTTLKNTEDSFNNLTQENEEMLDSLDTIINKCNDNLVALMVSQGETVSYCNKIEDKYADILNNEQKFKTNKSLLDDNNDNVNAIFKMCRKSTDDVLFDFSKTDEAYLVLSENLNKSSDLLDELFTEITSIQTLSSQNNLYAVNTALDISRNGLMNFNALNALDEIKDMSKRILDKTDQIALLLIQTRNSLKLAIEQSNYCNEQTASQIKSFEMLGDRLVDVGNELKGTIFSVTEMEDNIRSISTNTYEIKKYNDFLISQINKEMNISKKLEERINKITVLLNKNNEN